MKLIKTVLFTGCCLVAMGSHAQATVNMSSISGCLNGNLGNWSLTSSGAGSGIQYVCALTPTTSTNAKAVAKILKPYMQTNLCTVVPYYGQCQGTILTGKGYATTKTVKGCEYARGTSIAACTAALNAALPALTQYVNTQLVKQQQQQLNNAYSRMDHNMGGGGY